MASRCGEPRKFAGFTAAIVDDRRQNLISTRFRFPSIVVMMTAEAQLTPMMAQYRRIKGELPRDAAW
jgi:hypothetical protein